MLICVFIFQRDSLLATLLDAVRSCNNSNVHVRMTRTPRGKRNVPLYANVDEETEASLLRLIMHNFQYPGKRFEILERFNANIPHSGLNYSVTQDVSDIYLSIEAIIVLIAIKHQLFLYRPNRAFSLRTKRSLYWVHCKR